jgi:hypothetical protein
MTRFWTKYLLIPFVVLLFGQAFASDGNTVHKENLHEFIQNSHVVKLFDVCSNTIISRKGPDGIPFSDLMVETEEEQEIDKIISFKLSKNAAFIVPAFFFQTAIEQYPLLAKNSIPAVSRKTPQTQSALYLVFQVFRI